MSWETLLVKWRCEQPRAASDGGSVQCRNRMAKSANNHKENHTLSLRNSKANPVQRNHEECMHFKVNFTDNGSQSLFFSVGTGSTRGIKSFKCLPVRDEVFPFPFPIYFTAADLSSRHRILNHGTIQCHFCQAVNDTWTIFMVTLI